MVCVVKNIAVAIIVVFADMLLLLSPLLAFDKNRLDAAARKCEQQIGESAAVILSVRDGKIAYIYNDPIARNGHYPPGSIMKPLSALVLLEHGFNPSAGILCRGRYYPPKEQSFVKRDESVFNIPVDADGIPYMKCSLNAGHGSVSLGKAIAQSCNVFFLTAASRYPDFYESLVSLWALDVDPVTGENIFSGGLTSLQRTASAIGEGGGVKISPLKAAQCYALLAAGNPQLFLSKSKKYIDQWNDHIQQKDREWVLSTLSRSFYDGTLKELKISNKTITLVAGKTGTGTQWGRKYTTHGWAVIIFDYMNERYVLVSFVMKGSGSKEAARFAHVLLDEVK